jgi:ABC-type transport system substrate-binding protein
MDKSGLFKLKVHYSQNDAEHRLYRNDGKFDGMLEERGGGKESNIDEFIYRNYQSQGNLPRGEQAYPDPRLDALALAQRKEFDVPKRMELLKDLQRLLAELMPMIPGSWLYTTFDFRWPWLHNAGYGQGGGEGGQEVRGGHLHWLDPNMPNRERGSS